MVSLHTYSKQFGRAAFTQVNDMTKLLKTRRTSKIGHGSRWVSSPEVAQRAGVSQSAASWAFIPGASLAEDTRAKALAAAKELGYRPNIIVRNL